MPLLKAQPPAPLSAMRTHTSALPLPLQGGCRRRQAPGCCWAPSVATRAVGCRCGVGLERPCHASAWLSGSSGSSTCARQQAPDAAVCWDAAATSHASVAAGKRGDGSWVGGWVACLVYTQTGMFGRGRGLQGCLLEDGKVCDGKGRAAVRNHVLHNHMMLLLAEFLIQLLPILLLP